MFEYFQKHITQFASLTGDELKHIYSLSTEKKLRRKQFLLQEGDTCRHKAFVVKGLLRTFRLTDDGSEYNMRFAPENCWTLDADSFNKQQPSRFNIEALEDTEVLLWSKEDVRELFLAIPSFKAYSENLIANTLEAAQNRVLMNISATAEEKYEEFIGAFPDIFRRVPLHMVASYLGVSRETLSRVRQTQFNRQKDKGVV